MPSRSVSSLGRLPRHLWLAVKTFFVFRRPVAFLRHYVRRDWPLTEPVELRTGMKIYLSAADDIFTLVEVFLRRQYGRIRKGSVVIDIGANIGVFSLLALADGAAKVYAYEPSAESFSVFSRNIRENGVEDRVQVERVAVSDTAGAMVKFPVTSSRENAMITGDTSAEYLMTPTDTLQSLIDRHELERVDLLKLDCEGAEQAILLSTPDSLWRRIRDIRLEFHYEGDATLRPFLTNCGYDLVRHERTGGAGDGIMWFVG